MGSLSTTGNEDGNGLQVDHLETANMTHQEQHVETDRVPEAMGREQAELPKGYFYSPYFIGSYCAIGVAFACGTGGYALVAPILTDINNDLGGSGSSDINWVGIVYSLTQAIVLMLAGRLSDLFGRRWFFVIGSVIGLVGSIVGARAGTIGQLIAGETLIGIAAGFQCSFFWVVSEIVPMKRRFIANSGLFLWTLPTVSTHRDLCAVKLELLTTATRTFLDRRFQNNTAVQWRGCFYYLTALNALSVALWFFFYHPPSFHMLHRDKTVKQMVREFDFIGLVLFSAGMILFLIGLNWGGSIYPWKSGQVLGTLLSGVAILAVCIAYELKSSLEEPYLPLQLFKNVKYTSCVVWCAIEAMNFYAFGIIWPRAVAILYPTLSPATSATMSGLVTMSFALGQMAGPFFANWLPAKPLVIVGTFIGTGLLAACAANPLNLRLDGGHARYGGCIRLAGTSVAVAMYNTILNNRLLQTIPAAVTPVALSAGVPESFIPQLIANLTRTNRVGEGIPGLTAGAIALIQSAFQLGNSQAYSTVFLSTLGFGGVALILCFLIGGVDESNGEYVAALIQHGDGSDRQTEKV
ncbi:hypothetical protein N7519_009414 [Penicillium mononematosum]|uniref:uncharacterized protein n=1 Tax=Penicillium mononematosum TaxID=268346 RepID=UPI0025485DAC|nr:uncharacterized protein N7519_009414 [Penicillium mononematosum]KAJ6178953.1 hypothetical protein N7519_009414 [Penicillium mononematosum]